MDTNKHGFPFSWVTFLGGIKKISIKKWKKSWSTDGPDTQIVSSHGHLMENTPLDVFFLCFSYLSRSQKTEKMKIGFIFLVLDWVSHWEDIQDIQLKLGGKGGVVGGQTVPVSWPPPPTCHIPPLLFVLSMLFWCIILLLQIFFINFHLCWFTWGNWCKCTWHVTSVYVPYLPESLNVYYFYV